MKKTTIAGLAAGMALAGSANAGETSVNFVPKFAHYQGSNSIQPKLLQGTIDRNLKGWEEGVLVEGQLPFKGNQVTIALGAGHRFAEGDVLFRGENYAHQKDRQTFYGANAAALFLSGRASAGAKYEWGKVDRDWSYPKTATSDSLALYRDNLELQAGYVARKGKEGSAVRDSTVGLSVGRARIAQDKIAWYAPLTEETAALELTQGLNILNTQIVAELGARYLEQAFRSLPPTQEQTVIYRDVNAGIVANRAVAEIAGSPFALSAGINGSFGKRTSGFGASLEGSWKDYGLRATVDSKKRSHDLKTTSHTDKDLSVGIEGRLSF